MVAGRRHKEPAGRRRWAYGLIDLLVIVACSLVFIVVVTGSKGAAPRRAAVETRSHDPGLAPGGLHPSAAQDLWPAGPWTPSRPR